MRTIFIAPFFIFCILHTKGQNQKLTFRSVNQVGMLSGSNGEAFMLQSINGIQKDKWFAGVGTGLDLYNERTIPLFIDIRRDLTDKKNTPFAYVSSGINFVWFNFI